MSRSPVSWNAARRAGARLPTTSSTASASRSVTSGASSSGPSEPSRRRIGGTPTFRWMSLAPSWTARRSRRLSSIRTPVHRHARVVSLGGAREGLDGLHRRQSCALRLAGMGDLAEDQLLEHAPCDGQPHDGEDGSREAVERLLCAPAGRRQRVEPFVDSPLVAGDVAGDDLLGSELAADERLVDPVAGDGIEHAGRVTDDERAPVGELRPGAPHRQPVPAQIRELVQVDAVVVAQRPEVCAQARPFGAPTADADVDVVAFGEDPAVTARQGRELEHEHAAPFAVREALVREVAFERDAVDDVAAEAQRLGRDAVRTVSADQPADLHRPAVDTDAAGGPPPHAPPPPGGRAGLYGPLR